MKFYNQTLSDVFKLYETDKFDTIVYRDEGHLPDNKRIGQVQSICEIQITRNVTSDNGWTEFRIEETTTNPDSGRVHSRTISTCMPLEMAQRIGKFLNEGK